MRKYFGTDGVRGIANVELTPELAFRLGKSAGYVLTKSMESANHRPTFVVGRDTRISGQMLEAALISGLNSSGVDVVQLGILPTPGVALLTKELADGGVMISASHNPFQDNGIKFFNQNGFKLADDIELEIEHYIDNPEELPQLSGKDIGKVIENKNAINSYINFLKNSIDTDLSGLKIVLDCANGAATSIAPALFKKLGAEVIVLSAEPNGININVNCGSTHPANLRAKVIETKADIGLAFDGDADRLIAVNELGEEVDGDQILFICGTALSRKGKLKDNTVVSTVMSNFGFKKALQKQGLETVQSQVGDRYVLEAMLENGYTLGGEQSGHIIFLELNTTGDGILSALQLASVLKSESKPFSKLLEGFNKYPQELVNVTVKDKRSWESHPIIRNVIEQAECELQGNGRVLVRASGTENLVRVMVEGESKEQVNKLVHSIADEIKKS
ncbi:phosphoglucosamine mutase [Bacillus toyonensis]|uniref:phosphoglucosamine mutase n=1 Tax=Bacillus toyonensis TaxID=155322 RepID=UPI002E22DC97|nr:phosphoglucosamine mutase [Bacillus toyonensis]MED2737268.1 phosphoglucosamine mutase [Bacillus toyonensis]